jgi:ABC-type glycerol-3-phosphate transport system permease component
MTASTSRWRLGRAAIFCCLLVLGITTIYPLVFMASNSFRSTGAFEVAPYGLPTRFNLDNYRALLSQVPFVAGLVHSVVVVVPADVVATLFSALAAFVFTKTPFRGSEALFYVMLLVMLMPGVVLLIPLYVMIAHLGFANSFGPAILVYAAINIPYGTYLMRANFRAVPDTLIESARLDGASWSRIFRSVMLPVARPAVLTVMILTFLGVWNELFISIILLHTAGTEMLTPTLAQLSGQYVTDVPVLMAGLLLGSLPTLAIYAFAARYFVKGLVVGAIR